MTEITAYTSRALEFEPDTVSFIPEFLDYVVVGTYSLSSKETQVDPSDASVEQQRHGTLQILPFSGSPTEANKSSPVEAIASYNLPNCGVYSVHFHPQHNNLLGAATSDARIYLFDISASPSSKSTHPDFTLTLLGSVVIENPEDNNGQVAIITQFQFLTLQVESESQIALVATSQFGNTKYISFDLGNGSSCEEEFKRAAIPSPRCRVQQIQQIHQQAYNMEAWSVLVLDLTSTTPAVAAQQFILSGGDDNQLIVSARTDQASSTHPEHESPVFHRVLTDRNTHTAGIVTITSLGPAPSNTHTHTHLLATGSYDECLRIFLFDPCSPRPTLDLISQLHLPSGVWRITLLDQYRRSSPEPNTQQETNYILLVAGHTAGAFIVRLTITLALTNSNLDPQQQQQYTETLTAKLTEQARFTLGHQSLVYSCVARLQADPVDANVADKTESKSGSERIWQVLSCSFYDRVFCNWTWTDIEWPRTEL